ncbi:hypothetical protein GWR56_08380 [Mucilaginibacter sp. 14171R-50]|uniref:hypothetical protein n=1 Tax=Mucilaginibacter sp. 14171R-50 TaxID=2703789 RepID=UPI00138BEDE2|nr:hypothetical protein [Mucilaginibacter sp. 14171R-50]QHS55557.1 hypothetical protein GWR56_08380 [Mucilaginibacter sp. 14171R-50]
MSEKDTKKHKSNLTTIRFHFYSLKFTPYNQSNQSNDDILFKIITYVTNELHKGKGHLIDRNHNRPEEGSRELFMAQSVILLKEKRIRCTMALLRSGRVPMLKPADKFKLIPLDAAQGSIAEQTHFFIDYSRNPAVICLEFNSNGPRLSDIEYYLRNVARDTLKLAKATEVTVYMDTSIDKTLTELKNVLNIDIKIQPQKLAKMDTDLVGQYFLGINTIGQRIKPKFIKLEALFQTPGNSVKSTQLNKEANNMVINLLQKFKGRPFNIDAFENFVVRYEDINGKEEVFNLLKGKKEIIKEIDLKKTTKLKEWYELIQIEIDDFIQSL